MSSDQWGSSPWGQSPQQDPQVPPQYTPPAEYALQPPNPFAEQEPGQGQRQGQQQGHEQGFGRGYGQAQGQGQGQQEGHQVQGRQSVVYGAPQPQPQVQPQQQGQVAVPPEQFGGQPQAQGYGEPGTRHVGEQRRRGRNGVAVAGALTCFVPLVGLVLSIAGAAKAKALGAGRGVARAGIVLSLLFTLVWGGAGYYYFEVRSPYAGDAGCVSADADYLQYSTLLDQDAAAMTKGVVGSLAFTFAVKKYQSDLSGLIRSFGADAVKAGHDEVRAAIQGVSGDLAQLDIELGNLAGRNYAGATHVMELNAKLMTDFQSLESLCNSASVG